MKILIAGHGELPEALAGSARMIGGELPDVEFIGLPPGDTPQGLRDRMLEILDDFPAELILTDLAGGTPDNVANLIAKSGKIPSVRFIVAGVSLPLLLEFALSGADANDLNLDEVISESGAVVRFTSHLN
ncbi:MAG: PTS sugar transporter subunit IIA [Microbacteriaceae bacterium]|nr:PTS sugar transporter subunit IIA [Microbacteriaceae bacterium]